MGCPFNTLGISVYHRINHVGIIAVAGWSVKSNMARWKLEGFIAAAPVEASISLDLYNCLLSHKRIFENSWATVVA